MYNQSSQGQDHHTPKDPFPDRRLRIRVKDRKVGGPFPVGWTSEALARSYVRITGDQPLYMPHMVLLDRRGMIRSDFSGESSFSTNSEAGIRRRR